MKVSSTSSNNNQRRKTASHETAAEDCSETSVMSTSSSEKVNRTKQQSQSKTKSLNDSSDKKIQTNVELQGTSVNYLTMKSKGSKKKDKKKRDKTTSKPTSKSTISKTSTAEATAKTTAPSSPQLKRHSVAPPMKEEEVMRRRRLPKQLSDKDLDATQHVAKPTSKDALKERRRRPRGLVKSHSSPALSDDEGGGTNVIRQQQQQQQQQQRPRMKPSQVAAMNRKTTSLRNVSSSTSSTAPTNYTSSSSSMSSRPLLDDLGPCSSPRSISSTGRRFVQMTSAKANTTVLVDTDDPNNAQSFYGQHETQSEEPSKSPKTRETPTTTKTTRATQQAVAIAQKQETYHKYAKKKHTTTTALTSDEPKSKNQTSSEQPPQQQKQLRKSRRRPQLKKSLSSPALSDDEGEGLPRALRPSQVAAMQQKQQSLRNIHSTNNNHSTASNGVNDTARKLSTGHPDRPLMDDSIKMLHDRGPALQGKPAMTWREKRAAWMAEAEARRAKEQAEILAAKNKNKSANSTSTSNENNEETSSDKPTRPLKPSQIAAMQRKSASLRSFGSPRSLGGGSVSSIRTSVTDRPLLDDFGPPATERSYSRSSRNFHTYQDSRNTRGDDPNNRKSFLDTASMSSSAVANVDPFETPNFHGNDQRRKSLLGSNDLPDPALSPGMLSNPDKPYFVSAQLGALALPTFHDDDEDNSVALRNPYLKTNTHNNDEDDDATLESHDDHAQQQQLLPASCPSSPLRMYSKTGGSDARVPLTAMRGLIKVSSERDLFRQRPKDNPYQRSLISDDFSTGGFTPI